MSTKPILFNTEMVKAILDGRKTVTRRKIDAKAVEAALSFQGRDKYEEISDQQFVTCLCTAPCEAGDVLWVRETWNETTHGYNYKASPYGNSRDNYPWHPSIHMPKSAARLFLRVNAVRTERLQEITPIDCVREGVERTALENAGGAFTRGIFHDIWESTIKPADISRYGWDANPWVWAIEFERCELPEGFLKEDADHDR